MKRLTPKDAAADLVELFSNAYGIKGHPETLNIAKACAKICANEIKSEVPLEDKQYWIEVRSEIKAI